LAKRPTGAQPKLARPNGRPTEARPPRSQSARWRGSSARVHAWSTGVARPVAVLQGLIVDKVFTSSFYTVSVIAPGKVSRTRSHRKVMTAEKGGAYRRHGVA
jgi:hypothetical protein